MRWAMSMILAGLLASISVADEFPYRSIPLPGVEGRIDHMAFDERGGRLFVAALGNNTVEIVNVKEGKVAGRIAKLAEPQGVAYLADLDRLVVANGSGDNVQFYDAASLKKLGELEGLEDADNVRYDPSQKKVYVGFGGGKRGGIAEIDPAQMQKGRTFEVSGHPESFQLEKEGSRIFVNLPSSQQVVVIDRKTGATAATWKLDAGGNFPMALDESNHRLFVGCRRPAKVLVLDTTSGKAIGRFDLNGDCDDLFYDPPERIYASCGEGFLDLFERFKTDPFRQEKLPTAAGARTGFFAVSTGQFFLAVPRRGKQPAEIRIYAIRDMLSAPASPRR